MNANKFATYAKLRQRFEKFFNFFEFFQHVEVLFKNKKRTSQFREIRFSVSTSTYQY